MRKAAISMAFITALAACRQSTNTIQPQVGPITESIYASGVIKSEDQYQAFVTATGVIKKMFVKEGDTVRAGEPILEVDNATQRLNRENALLMAEFNNENANRGKLRASELALEVLKTKMTNDSLLWKRQDTLWHQQIGSRVEWEQRQLAYQNSRQSYQVALINYQDLQRQLKLNSSQSQKNLSISEELESGYTLRSDLDGVVYTLLREEGEMVNPQTPLAVIGRAGKFILEMSVDEYDIMKVKTGQKVMVTMDSYKDQVFEAMVSRIYPYMNAQSKTFAVEARFVSPPPRLYPNVTFEANIILQRKENATIIPRNYTIGDSLVISDKGDTLRIHTGLRDYHFIEVMSGLSKGQHLKKP